jgi:hypothetical protein
MSTPVRGPGSANPSEYLRPDEDPRAPTVSSSTRGRPPSVPEALRTLQRDRSLVRNRDHAFRRLAEVPAPRSKEQAGQLQEALEMAYSEEGSIDGESYRNLANAVAEHSQRLPATVASGTTTDRAAAARARAAASMAAQQQTAMHALESEFSATSLSDNANSQAATHAQALVMQGNIGTGGEAIARLRALAPALRSQADVDELSEALRSQHQAGAVNFQTYRVYAETLASIRPSFAANEAVRTGGPRLDARARGARGDAAMPVRDRYQAMIRGGASAQQVIDQHGITDPGLINVLRGTERETPQQRQDMADREAIHGGITAQQIVNQRGITDSNQIRRLEAMEHRFGRH